MDSEGYFKHLDIELLKDFAAQWVNDFDYIKFEKIELRRRMTPTKLRKASKYLSAAKYAVVFYTNAEEVDEIKLINDQKNGRYNDKLKCLLPLSPYERFVGEIEYYVTIQREYKALFGNDFKNVYLKDNDNENYLKEWEFIPVPKGGCIPECIDNFTPPMVLYEAFGIFSKVKPKGVNTHQYFRVKNCDYDEFGYSEFVRCFEVDDPNNWFLPRLEVRIDGIWVCPPRSDTLFPDEEAGLCEHPKKDLTKPALSFPCSRKQIINFFEFYGIHLTEDFQQILSMQESSSVPFVKEKIIDKKIASDCLVESIYKEAERCYDVYKELFKRNELSHNVWSNRIEKLRLKIVMAADIEGIGLHHAPNNKKRNITNAIVQNALKRIDPKNRYTFNDILMLIKMKKDL